PNGNDALCLRKRPVVLGTSGPTMTGADTHNQVWLQRRCRGLKPPTMQPVLDGHAAQIAKGRTNHRAIILGYGADLRFCAALPDAIADVQQGTLGVLQRPGECFDVTLVRVTGAQVRDAAGNNLRGNVLGPQ